MSGVLVPRRVWAQPGAPPPGPHRCISLFSFKVQFGADRASLQGISAAVSLSLPTWKSLPRAAKPRRQKQTVSGHLDTKPEWPAGSSHHPRRGANPLPPGWDSTQPTHLRLRSQVQAPAPAHQSESSRALECKKHRLRSWAAARITRCRERGLAERKLCER